MPIQIDRQRAEELAPRLAEALEIVCNEFEGLDAHRQYRNAFSRLLKADPLGRVGMMGTDQRDLFVPRLRDAITKHVPAGGGQIFDFGAGDGQTFALAADAVPTGTTVSVEEPNPSYLADYRALLERREGLRAGTLLESGVDDMDETARRTGTALPGDGTIDLGLGLHMIYFATNMEACFARMLRFVKPGGAFVNVVADETTAYGGLVLRAFIDAGGDTGDNDSQLAGIDHRKRLFSPIEDGGGAIVGVLADAGVHVEMAAEHQGSRLFAHSLTDLLALSNITTLMSVPGTLKFEVAARILREQPETLDLRIETEGVRTGMWSVAQPQWVTVLRRV